MPIAVFLIRVGFASKLHHSSIAASLNSFAVAMDRDGFSDILDPDSASVAAIIHSCRAIYNQTYRPGEPSSKWLTSVVRRKIFYKCNDYKVSATNTPRKNSKNGRQTDVCSNPGIDVPPSMQLQKKTPWHA